MKAQNLSAGGRQVIAYLRRSLAGLLRHPALLGLVLATVAVTAVPIAVVLGSRHWMYALGASVMAFTCMLLLLAQDVALLDRRIAKATKSSLPFAVHVDVSAAAVARVEAAR